MNIEKKLRDGRLNFSHDDHIENRLKEHFLKFGVDENTIWKNFPIYTRRSVLKRFLAHYELFQKTINLPGDIVELGIFRGSSLLTWANFLEIRNMGDRQKKVIGFDNFMGFTEFDEKDGKQVSEVEKNLGGFNSESFEESLYDAISIFDSDRFIPYKKRIHVVKGDIQETLPQYFSENPGIRISLLHFDVDLYKPTLLALKVLWPLVVKGGVVAFDEYAIPPWEGESQAVDEFFSDKNVVINRYDWSSNPGGYIIKE